MKETPGYVPRRMLLQWHVTERCNGHCRHCYQDGFAGKDDLDFSGLIGILKQFIGFLDECDRFNGAGRTRAHVTVTGGEPFQREDMLDLLDLLAAHRERFSLAILTNGTMIDDRLARYLGFLRPGFVQVSMDGGSKTHDHIRGAGNFGRVTAGIRNLIRYRVPTMVSFTAHRGNFREFPAVAKTARALGVNRVWADRLVPLGQGGTAMQDLVLTAAETAEFVRLISAARPRGFFLSRRRTEVACMRALQFLHSGERPYACTAGATLLTVMANGDLVPCRRMPIVVGSLREDSLCDLYWKGDRLRAIRRRGPVAGCEACRHREACRGGLRCLSHAVYGDSFRADPGCWLAGRKA